MNIGKKISSKDYKKCCYHWRIGAIIIALLFTLTAFYPYIYRIVYKTNIRVGNVLIVLPDRFFFKKKEEIMDDGVIDKGFIFKSYCLKAPLLISDITNINYEKKKEKWFSKKNCFVFKKKWRNYDVDLAMFLSPDFNKGDIFLMIIPDLKIMISFEDFDTLQEFMTKATFIKIKK